MSPERKDDESVQTSLRELMEQETERAHGREARSAGEALQNEIDALRAENERLRRAPESPKVTPKTNPSAPHRVAPARAGCDPHDPLCPDL